MNLDQMSVKEIMVRMNNEDKSVPVTVEKAFHQIEPVIQKVTDTIKNGGKIIYMGAGTSGRLGVLDASECPPTFGVSPDLFTALIAGGEKAIRQAIENVEDCVEAGENDAKQHLSEKDFLIAIAASGQTPYVIGGINQAKKQNIPTACIVCKENTKISQLVDYPIELIVGEEIIQGSTRLKAGTAQKLVLNMISTISMIKNGKVHDNYMVDVQATNQKLRNRAISITQEIADVDEEEARRALQNCDFNLKAAILTSMFQMKSDEACYILENNNNHLRQAIDTIKSERK
ncbi:MULTISPECIES: N-acetylmuramic acid 6-phosphate etherase [Virgibacillus]|uniref:N-acetylmuramic acid 6-phosphate etherase n=1 Tax=Virgibacillus pantothenticus TaxID=1473 RepID=A0A0L0QMI3_VIRPA|nr:MULTISPECIES: N-acetylmuramic acid 6-phosphate etherase [Virgibacillus]API93401.1 N-acetylmuramic acid 6-phosphate etherase [Virgibacillus sp. 6R]KNE19719.1 N-acetylmuramic acid-6-phosphate etherase [Virgibacillus pantothenticus]MBS7430233.1 N-acetylmuramic acid 6-phosphate etherase [Virgibacillus sp. 19R1-5]MBU8566211.1 N-acetylmuramic acid 6-phosphate etherase [Virgibacillus pantothenticus]MBU8602891.1 N-acetylmuramic acid 6-phosphate etherase [Virgibacillus pantothenticus]